MVDFNNRWSDEAVETLKRLHASGLSASQIVHKFALQGISLTRNSVCGKIHRLALMSTKPVPVKSPAPRIRITKPSVRKLNLPTWFPSSAIGDGADTVAPVEIPINNKPVTFDQLQRHHCRAPFDGADGRQLYCGNERGVDFRGLPSSYCKAHHAMFYVVPKLLQDQKAAAGRLAARRRGAA